MTEWNDISNNGRDKIPPEKLQAYIEGRLSAEEQRDIERRLSEEGMESDALEGLQHLTADETSGSVSKLNFELNRFIRKDKRKSNTIAKNNYWGLVAIVLILLLCLAAYAVFFLAAKE